MKITEKITEARNHTGSGNFDYAVNDIIDILEILAQPLQINGYERLVAERDTYKALVEKCIQATPEPDTTETAADLREKLDEVRQEIPRWCKLYEKVRISSSIVEKERDDLRELLRKLYPGISAMDLRREAAALLPDVEFAG